MGEKQTQVLVNDVLQKNGLFIDQLFRKAVIAHGNRDVYPGRARNQIGGKHQISDLGMHQPGGVTIGVGELHIRTQ